MSPPSVPPLLVHAPDKQEIALLSNAVNLLLPFAEHGDGDGAFHAPGIEEFLGLPALFFEGTPFEINRIILVRLLAITIMLVLWHLPRRSGQQRQ